VTAVQTQRDVILEQVERHGWAVTELDDYPLDWWADEIWLLKSVWSPLGATAYLTFLVDPQAAIKRKKGADVWAVSASRIKPLERLEAESRFILGLGSGWRENLPGLLEYLNALRHAPDSPTEEYGSRHH
jgi:hypothetical protein